MPLNLPVRQRAFFAISYKTFAAIDTSKTRPITTKITFRILARELARRPERPKSKTTPGNAFFVKNTNKLVTAARLKVNIILNESQLENDTIFKLIKSNRHSRKTMALSENAIRIAPPKSLGLKIEYQRRADRIKFSRRDLNAVTLSADCALIRTTQVRQDSFFSTSKDIF
jgi:hypothetical protein